VIAGSQAWVGSSTQYSGTSPTGIHPCRSVRVSWPWRPAFGRGVRWRSLAASVGRPSRSRAAPYRIVISGRLRRRPRPAPLTGDNRLETTFRRVEQLPQPASAVGHVGGRVVEQREEPIVGWQQTEPHDTGIAVRSTEREPNFAGETVRPSATAVRPFAWHVATVHPHGAARRARSRTRRVPTCLLPLASPLSRPRATTRRDALTHQEGAEIGRCSRARLR
jgi:hypothetical protein